MGSRSGQHCIFLLKFQIFTIWWFARHLPIHLENLACDKLQQIISNRFVATECPGQFVFDEILWGQGPASMAYFSRNFRLLRFGDFLEICAPVSKIGPATS